MRNAYFTLLMLLCVSSTAFADAWMKYLPDETYVSVLSIPGSHDSATGNGMSMPSFGQTQDLTFAQQWAIGIRAFDLRPKVSGDHLQINHGILATDLRFDDALYQLRDSLIKNPTEFAVIHLLYANGYDNDKDKYREMLLELLGRDDLKGYLVDFRADLTVGDMRGKILLLSRDQYGTKPVGGFFSNWCGYIDWNAQTSARITGAGNSGEYASAPLYVQDLSATYNAIDAKVNAIRTMLDFSTKHVTKSPGQIVWVYNFASAYTDKSISSSKGYRENATHTHPAILDYLSTHEAGPTGIILMDFAGVDRKDDYVTRGKELVDALIGNNFKYLTYETDEIKAQKAKYTELQAQIKELRTLRTSVRLKISRECPDVAGDFTEELNAIGYKLNDLLKEVNALYKEYRIPEDYAIDTKAIEDELDKILKRAQEAQRDFGEGAGIGTVQGVPHDAGYKVYSVTGELLNEPKRGAVNIFRYDGGAVRKIKY